MPDDSRTAGHRGVDRPLVLSLFPGIGLLDRAFEEEGFCVVRGPDLLWGGDVRRFHPPAGKFDGIIGGPPCKGESALAHLNGTPGVTLKHEFMRVWAESGAEWFVMEAVKEHKMLAIPDDTARRSVRSWSHFPKVVRLNNRWFGERQRRVRFFHSNLNLRPFIEVAALQHPEFKHAVLAGHGSAVGTVVNGMAKYRFREACELQGLPADYDLPGFTVQAKYEAVGNGVPLPMGRAIARAVRQAMGYQLETSVESAQSAPAVVANAGTTTG